MRNNHEPNFADRQNTANKAKQALLKKAKAKDPTKDPKFAEHQEARRVAAIARDARLAERKAERAAEKERREKEKADAETARIAAEIAEKERIEAEAIAAAEAEVTRLADQKAERDRRYAARKARRK